MNVLYGAYTVFSEILLSTVHFSSLLTMVTVIYCLNIVIKWTEFKICEFVSYQM